MARYSDMKGDKERALTLAEKALQLQPNCYEAHLLKGIVLESTTLYQMIMSI